MAEVFRQERFLVGHSTKNKIVTENKLFMTWNSLLLASKYNPDQRNFCWSLEWLTTNLDRGFSEARKTLKERPFHALEFLVKLCEKGRVTKITRFLS
jgi:hypothetical protein